VTKLKNLCYSRWRVLWAEWRRQS